MRNNNFFLGRLVLISFAIAAGSTPLSANEDTGPAQQISPVLGGIRVDWPWLMAVVFADEEDPYYGQFCAASLIAPQWAVSAAHCYYGYEDEADEVLLGTTSLRPGLGTRIPIVEKIIHENFVPPDAAEGIAFDNDIALLKLARPVTDVTPVPLPAPNFNVDDVPAGTYATLRGWGATRYDEDTDLSSGYPEDLMTIDLPLRSFNDCAAMGETWFSHNMLCAGTPEGGRDTCHGDSGGPLAIPADNGNGEKLIGVVSWGIGCGLPGYYGVYTRLSRYSNWISRQVCRPEEIPATPEVKVTSSGLSLHIAFTTDLPASSFRVYYTGLNNATPIRVEDFGQRNGYSRFFPLGVNFKFAVQSYKGLCNSGFSDITEVRIPGPGNQQATVP